MWTVENLRDAPMVPIAAFRDEKMARDFATMIGDGAMVEHREMITLADAEDIAAAAAQLMLEDIESVIERAIKGEAEGSGERLTLEEVLENIGDHDANDVASAAVAKRAA